VEWWPAYLAIGAMSGLLAGLLGVGGGVVMVPALTWVFAEQGVSAQHTMPLALGTSLATIVFTSLASTGAHHQRRAVDWRIVRGLAPGLMVGAFAGAWLASRTSATVLTATFGMFLWAVATSLLIDAMPKGATPLPGPVGLSTAGGLIGAVSGMTGIGGGTLTVPFLTRHWVPLHHAIGTAAAAGFPIAVAGVVGYLLSGPGQGAGPPDSLGFVHLPALLVTTVASIFAAPIGARVAHRLPTRPLTVAFAVLLYLVGAELVLSALRP
jgi:uncharacterized membrane protein YfcA